MTKMLASVTTGDEADLALSGGADIVDMKDPASGALGALPPASVAEIVKRIAGGRPCSAVSGDLPMAPATVLAAAEAMAATGVDYVKIGIFPDGDPAGCIRALAPLAQKAALIGVLFADLPLDLSLVALMARSGFKGAMLDTARKGAGRLIDHRSFTALDDFLKLCRAHGLTTGLAGSLEAPDVPRLLALGPEILGFRGALCAGHARKAQLDPAAFALIRALIPQAAAVAESPKVDWRLLSARGYSHDRNAPHGPTDKVFVRDLVLAMHIGAYGFERGQAQKVRFNVEADVARIAPTGDDMRDVFSYDVIRDAIGMILERGHIAMVETLAEEIAQIVLRHPRVVNVLVRVEKLEIVDGSLGVEIKRARPVATASVRELFPGAGRGA